MKELLVASMLLCIQWNAGCANSTGIIPTNEESSLLKNSMVMPSKAFYYPAMGINNMTTEEKFRSETADYTNIYGLVHTDKYPGTKASGNGIRYTSEYFFELFVRGWLNELDIQTFGKVIQSCETTTDRGLLTRGPGQTDLQAFDDYIVLTSVNAIIGIIKQRPELFECNGRILDYGKKRQWWYILPVHYNYNNVNPGTVTLFHSWLGRSPSFVAHLKLVSGENLTWFDRAAWKWTINNTISQSRTAYDKWAMSYYMVFAATILKGSTFFGIEEAKKFSKKFLEYFPNGITQLRGEYFNDGGGHPLGRLE